MDKTQYFDWLEQIIEAVEECGGESVSIAGGAIRDIILDKPITDIDVWYTQPLDKDKIPKIFKVEKVSSHEPYEQGEDDYFNVEFPQVKFKDFEYPIQLINTTDIKKRIECFPVNVSKISFDKDGLHMTKEFLFGMNEKWLIFDTDCPDKYKEKIIAKYSDYMYS